MRKILVQAKKEWAEFQRDKLSLGLAFILPLMTLLLFGYGVRMEAHDIPIAIQDNSNTSLSRSLIERISGTNNLKPIIWKKADGSPENMLKSGRAKAALIIPESFTRNLMRSKQSNLQLLVDGTDIINARLIESTVKASTLFMLKDLLIGSNPTPVSTNMNVWFNPGLKESMFIVPGVFGVVLWMFPALLACVATAREKEQGTIVQAFSSTIKPHELVLGKALVYIAVGLVQALLVFTLAFILFGIMPVREPLMILLTVPIYVATSVLFGLAVGSWANNQTTAVQAVSSLGFFTCLLLSGFVYPLSNIPFPLSLISYLVPARYFIEMSRDTFARGGSWPLVGHDPLILLLFVAGLMALSWLAWRRMKFRY